MIFQALEQLLNEFFVGVQERNVSFYHGDLFGRRLPFELAAGYIGDVKIEGIVGAVAGWPLEVTVNNVCLVLRPNQVQWENELLLRYAKELVVALWQSFLTPSVAKKGSSALISPAKWLTLLTIEKVSLYCDLNAETYWAPALTTDSPIAATANASSRFAFPSTEPSPAKLTLNEALENFRAHARKPFARDQRRELLFIRVIWMKLDFQHLMSQGSSKRGLLASLALELAAIDVVTEEIELNFDFAQVTALLDELEHLADYFKRAHWQQKRPSCIDRDRQTPPSVRVSPNALLPLPPVSDDDRGSLTFSIDKQRKSRLWFRAMWRYAFRCVLEQLQKAPKSPHDLPFSQQTSSSLWWSHNGQDKPEDAQGLHEMRRRRYIHLYARNLSPAALEIALYGRGMGLMGLISSQSKLKATTEASKDQTPPPSPRQYVLPEFEPLSLEESWELSDFILLLPVYEQRVCRAMAEQELRRDYSTAPASPIRTISPPREFPVTPTEMTRSPAHTRSLSVDSSLIPLDFAASHPQFARGATVNASVFNSALRQQAIRQASQTASRPHAASTSVLPNPTKLRTDWERAGMSAGKLPAFQTHSWLEQQCFPAWLLDSNRCVPQINWQLGQLTVRFSRGDSGLKDAVQSDLYVEIGLASSCGALLVSRKPFLTFLVEMRLGLVHATLVSHSHRQDAVTEAVGGNSRYNWISSDYIRTPADGFFYVGAKYSAREAVLKSTGPGDVEEDWGLKGRMCMGPLTIDCNEEVMRTALGETVAAEIRASRKCLPLPDDGHGVRATHVSILREVHRNCVSLVSRLPRKKIGTSGGGTTAEGEELRGLAAAARSLIVTAEQQQQREKKNAWRTRLLHAMLLRSVTFEVTVGALELKLSANDSCIQQPLSFQTPIDAEKAAQPEPCDDMNIVLPTTTFRLQNRPSKSECFVEAAGARLRYRSTKEGRAAVIRHLLQHFSC
ncbi:hypothetical protein BBJ28_00005322 [Nothophytophthora sp. Chile5]|nr:hypothetical protein BBJ28_00005322 [Nothophytophthora sp. Chile5]